MNFLSLISDDNRTIDAIDCYVKSEIAEGCLSGGGLLDFGCGKNKDTDWIGIDVFPFEEADYVFNIDKEESFDFLDSNSFSYIKAIHSLEHVENTILLWNEFYRICMNGGFVYAVVPHPMSYIFHGDPTHKTSYTEKTFRKYLNGEYINTFSDYGFKCKFDTDFLCVHGKDFQHLSIHALMRAIK